MTAVSVRPTRSSDTRATEVSWYLNVNYLCNERCTFCAAGLANGPLRTPGRPQGLTRDDVLRWLDGAVPAATDRVEVAGGEPTLHPDLPGLLRVLTPNSPATILFTNGLRLVDPSTAESVFAAGVTDVEVAFFGPDAASHEAVTRREGSFEGTLAAIATLKPPQSRPRSEGDGAPARVENDGRLDARDGRHAGRAGARHRRREPESGHPVGRRGGGWSTGALGGCPRRDQRGGGTGACRRLGTRVRERAAVSVRRRGCQLGGSRGRPTPGRTHRWPRHEFRYLDPYTAAGVPVPWESSHVPLATPGCCLGCHYLGVCGQVEEWYAARFGTSDLRRVRPRPVRRAAGPESTPPAR